MDDERRTGSFYKWIWVPILAPVLVAVLLYFGQQAFSKPGTASDPPATTTSAFGPTAPSLGTQPGISMPPTGTAGSTPNRPATTDKTSIIDD